MKKLLLVMLAVVLYSGCAEVKTAVVDNQKVWGDYVDESGYIQYMNNNNDLDTSPCIALDDIGFNVVGLDRKIADNLLSVDQYWNVSQNFMGGGNVYYINIRDGEDVEPGSVENKVNYQETSHYDLSLSDVIAEPGNENLDFGDEIFQIDIYSDPNHKFLIETFSFIL